MAFNFDTFGDTATTTPKASGGFDFDSFGSPTPSQQQSAKALNGWESILNFAQKLPTAPLGNAVGTSVRGIAEAIKTRSFDPLVAAGKENDANFSKIVGSTIYSAATPASFALAPLTIPQAALQFGALGAATTGGASLAKGDSPQTALKSAAVGGALSAGVGVGFKVLGNLLQRGGEKITMSVIKPSKADIEDGFSIETIKKYNLGGSLKQSLERTDTVMDDLSRQLNEKLKASNASINLNGIYERTVAKLIGNKTANFGSNSTLERAIEGLRAEIISTAGPNGIVSVPEAQTIKRASGHLGAWMYGLVDPDSTARQKVYNAFYNVIKEEIEKNSPQGVREINQQLSKLIPVMNAIIRRIPVADRNNALSLTDIISLTGAALEPRALALSLVNFLSKRGEVGGALMKIPNTTGAIPAAISAQTANSPTTSLGL